MISIIDEAPDYLIVYKPVGVQVHDAATQHGDREKGLISLLREQRNDPALFPVHRIDKATSGLLIVGRGESATSELSRLFQQRRVRKYYLAILSRKPVKKQGTVKGDMIRARNGAWRLSTTTDNPAITQFFCHGTGDGTRLAIIKPHTGKTHQIRVAMKSIAAPIVGDVRYGAPEADRVYLHAWRLVLEFNNQQRHWVTVPREGELFQRESIRDQIIVLGDPEDLSWPNLPQRCIE